MYGADIVCGTAGFCKCAPEDYMPVDGQCRHSKFTSFVCINLKCNERH